MRDINFVHVSADKKTATIGGGIVMKDLIEKLDVEGLVTPVGNMWIVGYVGWATLGGYGPMQHSHGMGIEQIVGAEMVTGKGEVVEFGEEDERLEGLRGMGGNLGVVTAVTIKVYPKIKVSIGFMTSVRCLPMLTWHRFSPAFSCTSPATSLKRFGTTMRQLASLKSQSP